MKKLGKAFGAVAAAGAVAAGGSAFTTSNALPTYNIAGFSNMTVTGVTVEEIDYDLSVDGDTVEAITVVTAGDTTHITLGVSFGEDAPLENCAAGTHDGGAPGSTTYLCNVTDLPTGNADDLNIAATET